jgi:Fe-S-cluster-containing hydrogenase component 2
MSFGAVSGRQDAKAATQAAAASCSACPAVCADSCCSGAIQTNPDGSVSIISEFCAGCGGCLAVCALQKIWMDNGVARLADEPGAG